jgi:hypothetical protein
MKIGPASSSIWDIAVWFNFACWGICFWWMHRLSSRQETMLRELQDHAHRIEDLSKPEHELLQQVHPAVEAKRHGGGGYRRL